MYIYIQAKQDSYRNKTKPMLERLFAIITSSIGLVLVKYLPVNSLWPSDAKQWQTSGSTLAQIMAWSHRAPSHYLNQCWLISVNSCGIHLRAISLELLKIFIKMCCKITHFKLLPYLPGNNELKRAYMVFILNIYNLYTSTSIWMAQCKTMVTPVR